MRVSNRCFAVTGLAYIPPWSVNAGFIAGDHETLVADTGASALSAAAIYGYAETARPGNRILVLNTEKHFDHIGGNGYFRDRGAEIFGHPLIARTAEEFNEERRDFNGAIRNAARRVWHEEDAFYCGTALVNPSRPIHDGYVFDLGGCTAEILATPGHTPTNLSAWVGEEGVLYCGDCLVNRYTANLDCGGKADWVKWMESLDRIERLKPRAIVPGHGPVALKDEVPRLIATVRQELNRAVETGVTRAAS